MKQLVLKRRVIHGGSVLHVLVYFANQLFLVRIVLYDKSTVLLVDQSDRLHIFPFEGYISELRNRCLLQL